ncbi:MAG: cytochrome c peroxidase [Bacteroidota bacterium]
MNNTTKLLLGACILLCATCSSDEDPGNVDPNPTPTPDPFAELNLPDEYFNYANIALPGHYNVNDFPAQFPFQYAATVSDNTPNNNPITDAGATLGRVLFYDQKLSANGSIACASCHQQSHGFSDSRVLSRGFDGGLTRRHSMGLANARFYSSGRFFWDERAGSLEEQVLDPFQDPVEMGLTLAELEQLVSEQVYYPPLFESAFGDSQVSSDRIARALAQFVRSIVSTNSRYDQARSEVQSPVVNFPSFTARENLGKDLFLLPIVLDNGDRVTCAGCHASEAFTGPILNGPNGGGTNATNNGLDAESTTDLGVFESTGNPNDIGKFKAPSLSNIAVRPPYMHDGRFATLEEVIDFYSTGIQNHQTLGPQLRGQGGQAVRINFTEEEKDALIAFLSTLTDQSMLTDEKYSDPFR